MLHGPHVFVGFGFGPIQAGLFALEAYRSGNFRRLVVAEVLPRVVEAVREDGGVFRVNVAAADGIETTAVGPVEMEDPSVEADLERIVRAVAEANEIATAVPSVQFYASGAPGSIHRVLARGLERRGGRPVAIYAAENNNHAAAILEEAVLGEVAPAARDAVRAGTRFLDTVIGKMSAVIADPDRIAQTGLRTIASRDPRAFLVESFNRILISRAGFPASPGWRRGIEVFEEKPDLLPFEEAKLHGHNAAHALTAYIAAARGLTRLEEVVKVPGAVEFVRAAFIEEAGAALVRKHEGLDPLFSEPGFRAYVGELMTRMLNPYLGDLVDRVARDPMRKLGWDDRLVGTMRLALSQGIRPRRFALGAAAALIHWKPELAAGHGAPDDALREAWSREASSVDTGTAAKVLDLVREALPQLRAWLAGGPSPFGNSTAKA